MKNSKLRLLKVLVLAAVLVLCLLLSGCVVPPDDIDTSGNYVVTDNDLPFQSLGPKITATPYIPPVTVTNTPEPTKNWNQGITANTPMPTTNNGAISVVPQNTATPNPVQNIISITPQAIINNNTPTPAASSTLKNGSTGSEVKKMQQRLKDLGYLKGSADGDFGDATETAVKAFQAQNGLTVDGKAGTQTLAQLYSSTAKRAPSVTSTNTPRVTNTPAASSLKLGATGSEVRRMQQRLRELGYLAGSADGDFGEATEAAVKAFQARNGLTVDGKAGTRTLEKLYSSSARAAAVPATATPRVTATPRITATPRPTATPKAEDLDYYLQIGSSGTRVRTLQNRLIALGWLAGSADGSYGNATEYAVKAFQARYSSLWKDGIAGPDTLKILYGAGAAKSSTPAASLGIALGEGDEGGAVRAMQKRLKELGYYNRTPDGEFGSITKSALIAFQSVNGLTANGVASTATLNKLYSASAKDADALKDDENARDEEDDYDQGEQDPEDVTDIVVNGYATLRKGDSGTSVKNLQRALKNRGYYSYSIDGNYGDRTVEAIMAFQRNNGLNPDGVAGPATQSLLFESAPDSSATSVSLKQGSTGTEVRNLQYVLYELGYYDGPINGEYGATTADAVRAFQINNNLKPVDGIAGSQTLNVIYSGDAIGASAPSASYTALSKGDKGTLVVELQETLTRLGYLSEVTGVYDSATVEAIKNFQRRNGLTADGKAGQETQRVLYSGNPTPAW